MSLRETRNIIIKYICLRYCLSSTTQIKRKEISSETPSASIITVNRLANHLDYLKIDRKLIILIGLGKP